VERLKLGIEPAVPYGMEDIATIKARMRAAQAAWQEARKTGVNLPALAKACMRLEGEYRLAKMGRLRKQVPAGRVSCDRCGGFGGHNQWPGFVCFDCDGLGHVEAK
jgi:hypothetical protein